MSYCAQCNAEFSGRFCSGCGAQAVHPQFAEAPATHAPATAWAAPAAYSPAPYTPGYVAPAAGVPLQSMGSTADNSFTQDADYLLRSTGERIVWQGKPSLMILMPRVLAWGAVVFFAMILAMGMNRGGGWILFWMFAGAVHIGAGYMNWRNTTYRVTSQRVEYSGGVLSCNTAASPLAQISNVTILRPFIWNLMGLGHVELDIPDEASRGGNGVRKRVQLKCLKNLETTRDLIHSSATILNQAWDRSRFGR